MPDNNDLEKRISDLQDKIQLLQVENDHLAERAEDTLLLGLIAEKINTTEDIEKVFELGLERISLLKDIPFCACCSLKDGNLTCAKTFFSFTNDTLQNDSIQLPEAITAKIGAGSYLLHGEECRKAGIFIPLQSSQYVPTSIFFIPFESRYDSVNLFFFAEDENEDRLASLDPLLHRIIEMIASRVDNLFLMNKLKKLNRELDQKVESRTKELLEANQDLQQQINERQQAEDSLRESEEHYRSLVENIDLGVTLIDADHRIVMVNKAQGRMFNRSPASFIGKNCYKEFEKRDRICPHCPGVEAMSTGQPKEIETEGILDDGSQLTVKIRAFPVFGKDGKSEGFIEVVEDITRSKHLMQEIEKALKLESIGIFAGGIAHDFNNLLTAILGNVSLAKAMLKPENPAYNKLTKTEKASLRAKDLTQQLLTFSKGGAPHKVTTSVKEIVEESASFALSGAKVKCAFSWPENLWSVEGDKGQIGQVIQNLVSNADQAMPEGGVIKIWAENTIIGDVAELPLPGGRYIKISIRDMGKGIPKEYLSKIFDPYFTTKQRGSGLGLAVCYSVIKSHHGLITVESEFGISTTFHIYLPASEKGAEIETEESETIRGEGTILVMDDEEMVREVLSDMLDFLGYQVELTTDGAEAIGLYQKAQQAGRQYDAVIMDLTVPGGMGGKEAIRKLLELDPGAKVIVSSGYGNDPIMAEYAQYGFSGVVSKPFKIETLSSVLHGVITQFT
jgi:PAS domain S-box-containing protein